jgi:hypothetical protein
MIDPASSPPQPTIPRHALAIHPLEGLALSLLAGFIVWGIVQTVHPLFRVPKEFDVPSIGLPTEKFLAHRREQDRVDRWHAALYLGGLGLLVAAAMSIREAVARRTWLSPLLAPPLAAVGGALGGYLGCMILQDVRINIGQAELKHSVEAQLAVALPLGLGLGLGLGLATRTISGFLKTTLGGLAAGAIAGVIYPVAVSVLLPSASADALLPEEPSTRLLWLGLLSGLLGLLIPVAGRQRQSAHASQAPTSS